MRSNCVLFAVAVALCSQASAQSLTPAFEAADVHVSATGATSGGGVLPDGRLEFHATTLLHIISSAWSISPDRVAGGPSWIDLDRFDLVARATPGTSRAAMRTMLQALLAQRFGLSVRTNEKPSPVFALVMGKHAPPKPGRPGEPGCERTVNDTLITYTCRNTTMQTLAEALPNIAGAYFNHPVVDKTNLHGSYDFQLQWLVRSQLPGGPDNLKDMLSIYSSLESALGVSVEQQSAPVAFLTIVAANRVPSPNPPGTAEKMGKTPTEFDVAELRPSKTDEVPNFKIDNGRIQAKSIPLKELILYAYNIDDDGLKGAERWMNSVRYDLVAKTAPTAAADVVRGMLQNLLKERFGLKVHTDHAVVNVYAMTAAKPKFREADPSERTSCKVSAVDARIAMACTDATMALFTEKLHDTATAYFDHALVDMTGLKSAYDLTVVWSPAGRTAGRPAAPQASPQSSGGSIAVPATADPTAELTIFEAVDRQLGLKIAVQKQTMPVIVIDHLERRPTEN